MDPSDIWYNIMLNTYMNQLKNICVVNKYTIQICKNRNFWKDKFEYDHVPFLIEPFYKINDIINAYYDIKKAHDKAILYTTFILEHEEWDHVSFQIQIDDLRNTNWLPNDIIYSIDFSNDQDLVLNFNINKKPISFNIRLDDEIVDLDYDSFIFYFTKLFYYEPNIIINTGIDIIDFLLLDL